MKILVTGGAGFIGSHVVDALIDAGHQVLVVDDLSTGSLKNVNPKACFEKLDICDSDALARVFDRERIDVICHQAARMSVQESLRDPLLYARVNVLGSLNLLECARRAQVKKIIYASTGGAVYGEPQYLPVDEDHPINPLDPYGASKHHVEHYLFLYNHNYGVTYTILRYSNVYGPRQNPEGEGGVVAIFSRRMLGGGQPLIFGSGEQERDFVYVGDVARANLLAVSAGDCEIVNIGTGRGTNINQIHDMLASAMCYDKPATHAPAKTGEVFKIWLKVDKAKRALGWEPKVGLDDGLKKTAEFFQTN